MYFSLEQSHEPTLRPQSHAAIMANLTVTTWSSTDCPQLQHLSPTILKIYEVRCVHHSLCSLISDVTKHQLQFNSAAHCHCDVVKVTG